MKLSRTVGLAITVSRSPEPWRRPRRSAERSGRPDADVVEAAGHLRVPADYRTLYQALESWAVAADNGPCSKEMQAVYAFLATIDACRKTGHLPRFW